LLVFPTILLVIVALVLVYGRKRAEAPPVAVVA
jgi:hypothetical protein